MKKTENTSIVLFDGVCNLCNASVQFIIKRDLKNSFKFAALQSEIATEILNKKEIQNGMLNSIVLLENDKIYTKSSAALRIAKKLSGPIKLTYGFIIIPSLIRDYCYDIIAKNRYTWFGEKDVCMIPSEAIKNKFLE